jgi:hypothetical protein
MLRRDLWFILLIISSVTAAITYILFKHGSLLDWYSSEGILEFLALIFLCYFALLIPFIITVPISSSLIDKGYLDPTNVKGVIGLSSITATVFLILICIIILLRR